MLKLLDNGPVFLAQRSRAAAVLLSVRDYERMAKRLQQFELLTEAKRISSKIASGQEETIAHDDLKRQIVERRRQQAVDHVAD